MGPWTNKALSTLDMFVKVFSTLLNSTNKKMFCTLLKKEEKRKKENTIKLPLKIYTWHGSHFV